MYSTQTAHKLQLVITFLETVHDQKSKSHGCTFKQVSYDPMHSYAKEQLHFTRKRLDLLTVTAVSVSVFNCDHYIPLFLQLFFFLDCLKHGEYANACCKWKWLKWLRAAIDAYGKVFYKDIVTV